MKKTNKEMEAIINRQLAEIKEFISQNPSIIYDLSKESGLSPEEIYQIINTDHMPIASIIRLHNAMQKIIEEKTKEILERDIANREAKAIINKQLSEIKDFIQSKPSSIYDLSQESGLSPEEIYKIISTDGIPITGIAHLHSTMKKMLEEKTKEILERNIVSKEAETVINRQLEEIKDFIKSNPSVIYDLSQESGLSPEEIYKITYTNSMPITGINRLHSAMQKMIEAQTQEIIEKNKQK